jgi:hypothetical protein
MEQPLPRRGRAPPPPLRQRPKHDGAPHAPPPPPPAASHPSSLSLNALLPLLLPLRLVRLLLAPSDASEAQRSLSERGGGGPPRAAVPPASHAAGARAAPASGSPSARMGCAGGEPAELWGRRGRGGRPARRPPTRVCLTHPAVLAGGRGRGRCGGSRRRGAGTG